MMKWLIILLLLSFSSVISSVAYAEDVSTLGVGFNSTVPKEFALYPAYPNPFNPKTTIPFTTDIAGVVAVDIYDINGRKIDELTHEFFVPGSYSVAWNASSLASGVYFVRLRNNTKHAILYRMMRILSLKYT